MFVIVQALQVLCMLFLLEFNDFVLCKTQDTVVYYICSRDFLWYEIDSIRFSHLSAGKLVSCQKDRNAFHVCSRLILFLYICLCPLFWHVI